MQLVETPAGDDCSWILLDFEEIQTTRQPGRVYKCILPAYRLFNPYDRSNSPYSTVFQPILSQALLL
jgi:hypothetical protein